VEDLQKLGVRKVILVNGRKVVYLTDDSPYRKVVFHPNGKVEVVPRKRNAIDYKKKAEKIKYDYEDVRKIVEEVLVRFEKFKSRKVKIVVFVSPFRRHKGKVVCVAIEEPPRNSRQREFGYRNYHVIVIYVSGRKFYTPPSKFLENVRSLNRLVKSKGFSNLLKRLAKGRAKVSGFTYVFVGNYTKSVLGGFKRDSEAIKGILKDLADKKVCVGMLVFNPVRNLQWAKDFVNVIFRMVCRRIRRFEEKLRELEERGINRFYDSIERALQHLNDLRACFKQFFDDWLYPFGRKVSTPP
jgi:hypothetical protein